MSKKSNAQITRYQHTVLGAIRREHLVGLENMRQAKHINNILIFIAEQICERSSPLQPRDSCSTMGPTGNEYYLPC